jgi:dihydropteroate synthase
MGIVNVTPDSFSDGGKHYSERGVFSAVLAHCEQLIADGADLLDIGGESTRPGAPPVSLDEELARVLPVVREAVKLGVPLSIDSYKPEVMQALSTTSGPCASRARLRSWRRTRAAVSA